MKPLPSTGEPKDTALLKLLEAVDKQLEISSKGNENTVALRMFYCEDVSTDIERDEKIFQLISLKYPHNRLFF